MSTYTLEFKDINRTDLATVGGKGANLGELSKIADVYVPEGFCVTTKAYQKIIENNQEINGLLDELAHYKATEQEKISGISAKIHKAIERTAIPKDIEDDIAGYLRRFGENNAYAVRSSATAEDLPTASFAGQQNTYLNIIGKGAIMEHISKCWASLFTERAVIYRIQNCFDHRKVYLAVVVQKMVFPAVAGVMFTADPISSNRKVLSIDASFGLGEALVSGLVNADNYKVHNGKIIDKTISNKKLAIHASDGGGTQKREIDAGRQNMQALTDDQIQRLEHIGRKIETHFGSPQDIEWCMADDTFYIVQSRPITTLFPIPEGNDREKHVYISVGHQQMMTDAMKPLGISMWQLTALRPMYKAGGRLFVDVTPHLASAAGRTALLATMREHDPLMKDALNTLIERGDFLQPLPDEKKEQNTNKVNNAVPAQPQIANDPAIVTDLINNSQASIDALKQNIQTKSGTALFDFILEDIQQLKKSLLNPQNFAILRTAMDASSWLNENINKWLGEKNVADTLSQSVPNNVTAEMGLALLDVADAIRPYPEVVDYLKHAKDDSFLEELVNLKGGQQAYDAIQSFLNKYGMRCAGEIDITKQRWSEKPITLVPIILSNVKNFTADASKRKFEQGKQEAWQKEEELVNRLKQLPDGEQKAEETKQKIDLLRNFTGYREYPKYSIVNRHFVYKQALLKEAERLVRTGAIHEKDDIYYLTFEELKEAVRTNKIDHQLISHRKDEHKFFEKLTPSRVITSDGEIIMGVYTHKHIPANAIAGLAVSAGVAEGRARVILNLENAHLENGDILVTRYTDPSWTPVFVSIKGLVTEVGGLMTHGAVIAREYGLPAIVGVENATSLIRDGQRIRVNGTDGYVEIL